jgi:hypothetical protein
MVASKQLAFMKVLKKEATFSTARFQTACFYESLIIEATFSTGRFETASFYESVKKAYRTVLYRTVLTSVLYRSICIELFIYLMV